jgi:enterochelin esterase-like enzyme
MIRAMMRFALAALAVLFIAGPAAATDITPPAESPRIQALTKAAAADPKVAATFWAEVETAGTPLMEPDPAHPGEMIVTFLARSTAGVDVSANPAVFFQGSKPQMTKLTLVPGTDVWSASFRVSTVVRSGYGLVWPRGRTPDKAALTTITNEGVVWEMLADPLAKHSSPFARQDTTWAYPWFEGPNAPKELWVAERPGVPKGAVETSDFASRVLGDTRKVSIYTPPGYDPKKRGGYGLFLVFDREEYLSVVPTPILLDNLIADGEIPPVVAVFVSSLSGPARVRDLVPNDNFQSFIHTELVPWARAQRNLSRDPRKSAVAGSSLGGLSSLYTGLKSSDLFGNVVSQSASLWWTPGKFPEDENTPLSVDANRLSDLFTASPRLPLNIWMDVGLWERHVQVTPNRQLRNVLLAKGYPVTYQEFEGGHDYIAWRRTLAEGLIATIGNDAR